MLVKHLILLGNNGQTPPSVGVFLSFVMMGSGVRVPSAAPFFSCQLLNSNSVARLMPSALATLAVTRTVGLRSRCSTPLAQMRRRSAPKLCCSCARPSTPPGCKWSWRSRDEPAPGASFLPFARMGRMIRPGRLLLLPTNRVPLLPKRPPEAGACRVTCARDKARGDPRRGSTLPKTYRQGRTRVCPCFDTLRAFQAAPLSAPAFPLPLPCNADKRIGGVVAEWSKAHPC